MQKTELVKKYRKFLRGVGQRVRRGQKAYKDKSFERSPEELIGEIREELADVVAWSFVLDSRIEDILTLWKSVQRKIKNGLPKS